MKRLSFAQWLFVFIICFLAVGVVIRLRSPIVQKQKEEKIKNKMLIYSIGYKEGVENVYENFHCYQEGIFKYDSINMRNSLK